MAGPLFTSPTYPWPSQEGRWLEPVLQIDLALCGSLGAVDLDNGWLQVWGASNGAITRVVTATEIETAAISPVPSHDPADYHHRLVEAVEGQPGWVHGQAIEGFAAPYLDYGHNELLGYAEWLIDEPPVPLPPPLIDAARALKIAIEADTQWYALTHRVFGMINEGDLSACDFPPVLFVLEEGVPLRESGHANDGAYVCYGRDERGGLTFSVNGLYF